MKTFLKQAAAVRPTKRQLDWFDTSFYGFVHFGPNTFTNREWGRGDEPEAAFHPTALDCDQWVAAIKSAGMKAMVLTAKHHDGFCLWPSKYTEHSVKNSPFQGDVVRLAADACRRGGLKFGFYLSPWDRNSKYYGTPQYNDYFCNQLTELLTEYGDIFCVWFDNACSPEMKGKQPYDFPRYFELIRKYQPNAVIFNDYGPDVRWCGNEAGDARYAEWAVVPTELCRYAPVQTGPGPLADCGTLEGIYNTDQSIGSLPNILYTKGLAFVPSEIDMSIRPGWFWHPDEEPHSLARLFDTYIASVGANACFHLNVPPDTRGLIDDRDAARLKEFGDLLRQEFGTPVPAAVDEIAGRPPMQKQYRIRFDAPKTGLRYIVLEEDIAKGQRVESFTVTGAFAGGGEYPVFQGACIGHKKICRLADPFARQNPLIGRMDAAEELIVTVTAARDEVFLKRITVY